MSKTHNNTDLKESKGLIDFRRLESSASRGNLQRECNLLTEIRVKKAGGTKDLIT